MFPEIDYDKVDALRGMNITITTTAKTDKEARALLAAFLTSHSRIKVKDYGKEMHGKPGDQASSNR